MASELKQWGLAVRSCVWSRVRSGVCTLVSPFVSMQLSEAMRAFWDSTVRLAETVWNRTCLACAAV